MLSAIVLLNTERDKTNKVAETLADLDGVTEVYSVAGRYDLAAIVRASDNDQLAKVVTEKIRGVPGITSSETLIAFASTRVMIWNGCSPSVWSIRSQRLKKTHLLRCARSPRFNVQEYASARRFFARLVSEYF